MRTLAAVGELAAWSGDLGTARPLIEEAIAVWRAWGKTQEFAGALIDLGWGCFYSGDADARWLMEEGLRSHWRRRWFRDKLNERAYWGSERSRIACARRMARAFAAGRSAAAMIAHFKRRQRRRGDLCSELRTKPLSWPFDRGPKAEHNLTRGTAMHQSGCRFQSGSNCT
jgi:hypothetical protein